MRQRVFAANWKMHKIRAEAHAFVTDLFSAGIQLVKAELVICAPFTALSSLAADLADSNIAVGAQNFYYEPQGAYTGEISAAMLKDCGCTYVIIGHSERRNILGEDDHLIRHKLEAALNTGLIPILCIGETLEQRHQGQAMEVVRRQLESALVGLNPAPNDYLIAYEPVWAIGTGVSAEPEDAQVMSAAIRAMLEKRFDRDAAGLARILYGGSVNPSNAAELMRQPDIDGALIGGASLNPFDYAEIIRRGIDG